MPLASPLTRRTTVYTQSQRRPRGWTRVQTYPSQGTPSLTPPNTSITKMRRGVISNCCTEQNTVGLKGKHLSKASLHHSCTRLIAPCFWLAHSPGFNGMPYILSLPKSFHHLLHPISLHPPSLYRWVMVVPSIPRGCVSQAYQNADGLVQRTAGFQALLAVFNGVFPLQAHLNEHLAFGFFALGVKDEVTCGLILNSWRRKEVFQRHFLW